MLLLTGLPNLAAGERKVEESVAFHADRYTNGLLDFIAATRYLRYSFPTVGDDIPAGVHNPDELIKQQIYIAKFRRFVEESFYVYG